MTTRYPIVQLRNLPPMNFLPWDRLIVYVPVLLGHRLNSLHPINLTSPFCTGRRPPLYFHIFGFADMLFAMF